MIIRKKLLRCVLNFNIVLNETIFSPINGGKLCCKIRAPQRFSMKWQSQVYIESTIDGCTLRYTQYFPFPLQSVMKEKEETKTTELQQPTGVLTPEPSDIKFFPFISMRTELG